MDESNDTHRVAELKPSECSICLEAYESNTEKRCTVTPCGHLFCRKCILQVIDSGGRSSQCPTCRRPFTKKTKNQLITLYDTAVTVLDTSELHELRQKIAFQEFKNEKLYTACQKLSDTCEESAQTIQQLSSSCTELQQTVSLLQSQLTHVSNASFRTNTTQRHTVIYDGRIFDECKIIRLVTTYIENDTILISCKYNTKDISSSGQSTVNGGRGMESYYAVYKMYIITDVRIDHSTQSHRLPLFNSISPSYPHSSHRPYMGKYDSPIIDIVTNLCHPFICILPFKSCTPEVYNHTSQKFICTLKLESGYATCGTFVMPYNTTTTGIDNSIHIWIGATYGRIYFFQINNTITTTTAMSSQTSRIHSQANASVFPIKCYNLYSNMHSSLSTNSTITMTSGPPIQAIVYVPDHQDHCVMKSGQNLDDVTTHKKFYENIHSLQQISNNREIMNLSPMNSPMRKRPRSSSNVHVHVDNENPIKNDFIYDESSPIRINDLHENSSNNRNVGGMMSRIMSLSPSSSSDAKNSNNSCLNDCHSLKGHGIILVIYTNRIAYLPIRTSTSTSSLQHTYDNPDFLAHSSSQSDSPHCNNKLVSTFQWLSIHMQDTNKTQNDTESGYGTDTISSEIDMELRPYDIHVHYSPRIPSNNVTLYNIYGNSNRATDHITLPYQSVQSPYKMNNLIYSSPSSSYKQNDRHIVTHDNTDNSNYLYMNDIWISTRHTSYCHYPVILPIQIHHPNVSSTNGQLFVGKVSSKKDTFIGHSFDSASSPKLTSTCTRHGYQYIAIISHYIDIQVNDANIIKQMNVDIHDKNFVYIWRRKCSMTQTMDTIDTIISPHDSTCNALNTDKDDKLVHILHLDSCHTIQAIQLAIIPHIYPRIISSHHLCLGNSNSANKMYDESNNYTLLLMCTCDINRFMVYSIPFDNT